LVLKFRIGLLLLLVFSFSKTLAQVCTGSLGNPIVDIDFGKGLSSIGSSISETSYLFKDGTPGDGEYTIVKTTAGLNVGWHQNIVSRKSNDNDGYFMVVNADYVKGVFYEKVINVCPNTTYAFAAYLINILRNPSNDTIRPNIKFTIEYNSNTISILTGDISESNATNWIQYGTLFTTPPGTSSVRLKMTNENPGGNGNDLAIDDITFSPCGPVITPSIDGEESTKICEGQTQSFQLSATVSSGYTAPKYQWQELNDNIWTNITGKTSLNTNVQIKNAVSGTYQYRLFVTEDGNVGSINCGVFSAPILVNVIDNAKANAGEDKKILAGQSVALNGKATGDGTLTYAWSPTTYLDDPSKLNPIATPPTDITYTLTVTSACNVTTDEVFVKVYPKIEIPNAFSPNSDGVNDTWNVSAAIAFPNPQLKIFNRNGQILYESKGAFKPWDGKFNGHDLPVAAYYYTLFLNEDFKPFTGWILLTR